jgi:lysozyme
MKIGEKGIALLKHSEGCILHPYMDVAGVWTIGYGHAILYHGNQLKGKENKLLAFSLYPGFTPEDSENLLKLDLNDREVKLSRLNISINQDQFDALMDFIYNIGWGGFLNSTLLKRIKTGIGDITEAFLMWNKAGGKVVEDLVFRRKSDALLYTTGELKFFN